MIIDCHGHYTTAPAAQQRFRDAQLARLKDPAAPLPVPEHISDDEIRESIETHQLKLQRLRGADLTLFSPRASGMGHHIGNESVSSVWTRVSNDLVKRVVELYPDNFAGVCQLPQSPGAPIEHSVGELERCVRELGFIGCNLNSDRYWYPLYEKMIELEVPAMVHVSASCNPNFHATGAHYINADTTAFMQFIQGNLFHDFPTLKLIIPHGGGAVPYHWGRYRGLADMLKRPPLREHVMRNVFFDTCVYHQPGIDLLVRVIDIDNILFGSEMIGAVRGVDPETGFYFDDTKRYIDALSITDADKMRIFEQNSRRVFPRLDALLKGKGK
jgi:4-oxalmesaconate hydratase